MELSPKAQAEHADALDRAWANVLGTKSGRRVVMDVMGICNVMGLSYTGNADTNFNEGARNVGLRILAERIAKDSLHTWPEMQVEHGEWMESLAAIPEE